MTFHKGEIIILRSNGGDVYARVKEPFTKGEFREWQRAWDFPIAEAVQAGWFETLRPRVLEVD